MLPGVERNFGQEIKVGLFVLFFLTMIAAAVFILGGGKDIFAREYVLHTKYGDVKGMKVGAGVRLAGIDVGEVSRVEFSSDPAFKQIEVELRIRQEFQERVRADSAASIQQIGLLGDMYVSISVGSVATEILPDGADIEGVEALNMLDYAATATDIVGSAKSISHKVDLMLGSDDAAAKAQIAKSIETIGLILVDARDGDGLLHTLLYDKAVARRVGGILTNVEGITADVHDITTGVRSGDGIANALVYGKDGKKLSIQLAEAADAVSGLLADLKSSESLAHSLLYDPEQARIVADLADAATAMKGIAQAVSDGEGTAGLLVRDPQLYEDLRGLVGGAQRNALLRAYIRSTVARGREENAGVWMPPADGK